MSSQLSAMAVVCDKLEAQKALELLAGEKNFVIIALTLSAESYISRKFPSWHNPLYELVRKKKYKSSRYTFENFSESYNFCGDTSYKYIRDRLGYFLAELERSLDLARDAVNKFNPNFLIIGALKNYPGSSVVDGTLKTNAFFLLAKEAKIPYRIIESNQKSFSFKQSVGKKIQLLRYLNKQKIQNKLPRAEARGIFFLARFGFHPRFENRGFPAQNKCDLLILATPRHLIQMAPVISEIKRRGINLTILTYNVTLELKKSLDENFSVYLEKERLIDSSVRHDVKKVQERLSREKPWNKYSSKKYKSKSEVLNYIRQKIEDIINNETAEIFSDILLAEKVLSGLRPKALLTTTDPDSKILPYIDIAKEYGIKTICIQHGAFYGKDSPAVIPASDYFIAWSEISKNWLKRSDYFKHLKILVGNSPFHHYIDSHGRSPWSSDFSNKNLSSRFAELSEASPTARSRGPRLLEIETPTKKRRNDRLTILYLATKQPTVDKGLVMFYLRKLFETLSKTGSQFKLIIRVHPFQDTSNFQSLAEAFDGRVSLENEKPLGEVIEMADIVFYENTTAGFDAMLSGKPTVYFNPYSGEDFYNVKKHKASLTIINDKDLGDKLLNFLLKKKDWENYSIKGKGFAKAYLGLLNPATDLAKTVVKLTRA